MTRVALYLFTVLAVSAQKALAQQTRADTLIVHFAFNRSTIRPADSVALLNLTAQKPDSIPVAGKPDTIETIPTPDSVLLIGYTDTTGSNAYNDKLSYRRALAAKAVLRTSIPIRLEARGETDPLPGNDSLNRRAALILYYHNKPASIAHIDTPQRKKLPGDPDTVITLNHINFIANKAELTEAAVEALPSTIANLSAFRDRYLEIDGYCNQPGPPLPKTDLLFILSVDRAKYIYHYLITQGFDASHLSYKGLGNASPVNAHPTTASEMDQNMRVEIKVFAELPKP